jgi:putative ABC transport system substrate-binding protein
VAELGMKVIEGQNPGSIPWEYPRKFSIIINKMTADRLGIAIPSEILGAAFRIYTDYKGNYIGQSD